MQLIDLLTRDRVHADVRAVSKKRVLEHAAALLASGAGADIERRVFDALVSREHLGSTGLGQGVAIPHGRVAAEVQPSAAFLRLKQAIDFDSPDGEPVDLVLALMVPEHFTDQHLSLLAQVADLFSRADVVADLRAAPDTQALYQRLSAHTVQSSEA